MAPTLNPTLATITNDVAGYTPAVLAGVQAAEQSTAGGSTKLQAVVNGVLGTTGALETNTNPNVAAVSALANLIVGIFNALGIFGHKSAPAAAAPTT